MPGGIQFADWRYMQQLDGATAALSGAFVIGFKITDDNTGDVWSNRFVRFKNKDESARYGAAASLSVGFTKLLSELKLEPGKVVIVPALSSGEEKATQGSQLVTLGEFIAGKAGCLCDTQCLSKNVHSPIHKQAAGNRDAELEKAQYVAKPLNAKTAFVFDDFITKGSTMSKIAEAILAVNPGIKIYGMALGKTERLAYWGANLRNDFIPPQWDSDWTRGEAYYKANKR